MTQEEIIKRQREEEDYYQKKKWELPHNDKEAQRRYDNYRNKDPYLSVEPALLNSADIFKYVAKTGMIYPFNPAMLQGASYEVPLRGTVIWWDDENQQEYVRHIVKEGDSFELKPNSIAFITLEPTFRIPYYMALRFNLRIVHVYKGLLLGTGPLVDPGFVGRLSIPLHNLTANTYTFKAGDGIIQMEFTKLSKNSEWKSANDYSSGLYKRKWIKPGRDVKEYIKRSLEESNNKVVKSSIPEELTKLKCESAQLKEESNQAREEMLNFKATLENTVLNIKSSIEGKMESFQNKVETTISHGHWFNWAIIGAVVAIVGFGCTVMYQICSSNVARIEQTYELQKECNEIIQEYDTTKKELNDIIKEFEKQLKRLEEEKNGVVVDGQEN